MRQLKNQRKNREPINVLQVIADISTERLAEKMYYPMKVTQQMLEQALYIRAKSDITLKSYVQIYIPGAKWQKASA